MFCSIVIPSIGRPTLSRSVLSLLEQTFSTDDFEIIIVNDAGHTLPEMEWQQSNLVRIVDTNQHERSVARNTGAAMATGQYLLFLDDDDWLANDALQKLWDMAQISQAAWLYGSSQLVDRNGNYLLKLRHGIEGNCFIQVMAGEWIPLQASLIKVKVFFEVGGFNPHISGPEDIDLLRRIAFRHELAGTDEVVAYIVRGEAGSTTDYISHPEQSRWAREDILDSPGVLSRMQRSANNSYWRGRIVRTYLTSVIWNIRHERYLTAVSRSFFSLFGLLAAGSSIFSNDFRRAIAKPYTSETFLRGLQETSNAPPIPQNSTL